MLSTLPKLVLWSAVFGTPIQGFSSVASLPSTKLHRPFSSLPILCANTQERTSSSSLTVEDPRKIRNVAVVGHSHHGKTALLEWILYDEHVLTKQPQPGATSVLDADPTEAARSHSIFSHYCKCLHAHHLLALADTPWGDFPADALASVDGTDAAILVISAADSVQSGTISAFHHCVEKMKIPTLVALSKLDRPFLLLDVVLQDIESNLGTTPLPLQVIHGHVGGEDNNNNNDKWEIVPIFVVNDQGQLERNHDDAHQDLVRAAWTKIEEAVAMTDDDLLVEYLEQGVLETHQAIQGLKRAVLHNQILPLVYTAAEQNRGVQELMDVIVGVLPSPMDVREEAIRLACEQEAAKCELKPGIEAGFCARVLHTTINSFGSLSVLRVISNSYNDKEDAFDSLPTEVVNLRTEEKLKLPSVATSFSLSGKDRLSLQEGAHIVPGDVIAVPKLPETVRAHDILSVPEAVQEELSEIFIETEANLLTPLSRPEEDVALMTCATVSLSRSSSSPNAAASGGKSGKKSHQVAGGGAGGNNSNNDDKLVQALRQLAREDLALRVEHDAASGKLLVSCMSAEHLQLLALRLEDRYALDVEFGRPPVQYRETLVKLVKNVEGKHKKQSGGSGQFGVCYIDMEPLPEGTGIEFESKIKGGVISKPFISSVEKGVREQLQAGGPLGGFPVTDVRVTLVDGKMHSVDSKDIAFQSAGKQAVKAALERGKTRLLQPMEKVTFVIDNRMQGDVNAIVSRYDGYVTSSTPSSQVGSSELEMEAILPTACIGQVSDSLRATTAGEAHFSSEFSHYQPVPDPQVKSIIGDLKEDLHP